MIKYENSMISTFSIDNYLIKFPFEPYESQKNIIKNILSGIIKKQNSIIESPTGTGKCLSALASVFAFLRKEQQNKNFIEEKKIIDNIRDILMIFEEIYPKLEKLMKIYKFQNKKNSLTLYMV